MEKEIKDNFLKAVNGQYCSNCKKDCKKYMSANTCKEYKGQKYE